MHFDTVTIKEVTTKVTEVATLHNTEVEEVDINLPEVVMNHQEVVTLEAKIQTNGAQIAKSLPTTQHNVGPKRK